MTKKKHMEDVRRREYQFPGYYSEKIADEMVKALHEKTYMDFVANYSNMAGNCTVFVSGMTDDTQEDFERFVIFVAVSELAARLIQANSKNE